MTQKQIFANYLTCNFCRSILSNFFWCNDNFCSKCFGEYGDTIFTKIYRKPLSLSFVPSPVACYFIHLSLYHPPTYEACNIILLNMKNHYRRLYTVKPAVDTSPPESYKLLSRKTSRSLSCLDLSISDIPSYKFYRGSEALKSETNRSHESQKNIRPIIKRHSCINDDKNSNHNSRAKSRMKSAVSSEQKNSSSIIVNSNSAKDFSLREKLSYNIGKTGSESSQDSAYNEGEVGSSERGSRTPTPETIVNNPSKAAPSVPLSSATYRRKVNNYLYLKFLTDITDEILKKGVVTNKALKRIFQDHLEANYHHLNQSRMLLELETLREKLGIPEDDHLNSADFGLGSGNGSPSCLPLFREEDVHLEEIYEKFSPNKSKSVFIKGLMTSKNSLGSDMLEAFTTLSDNKKLIDTIQASLKNTTTNLHQASMLSSQFSPGADINVRRKSSGFEYDSPRKVSESKALLEENAFLDSFQNTSENRSSSSQSSNNANVNQQKRPPSNFSYDSPLKVHEYRISSAEENTFDSQQKMPPGNYLSPSEADIEERRSSVNLGFDFSQKTAERKISSSDENTSDSSHNSFQKTSEMNSQSPKKTVMNQPRRPSSNLSNDPPQKVSERISSSDDNIFDSQPTTSPVNCQSPSAADAKQGKRSSCDFSYDFPQNISENNKSVLEGNVLNSQQKMFAVNCNSDNADMNKQRRSSSDEKSVNDQRKTSAVNNQSQIRADDSQGSMVSLDASQNKVSQLEGNDVDNPPKMSASNSQLPSNTFTYKERRASVVEGDSSRENALDNAEETSQKNRQLSNDVELDSLRRPSPDLRCDTPCESSDGKSSTLGGSTINNTCSDDFKSLVDLRKEGVRNGERRASLVVEGDSSLKNAPDNAEEPSQEYKPLSNKTDLDPLRSSSDLRCETPCESSDGKSSSAGESTINNTCSDALTSLVDPASNQGSSSSKDFLTEKQTEVQNLGANFEKESVSHESSNSLKEVGGSDSETEVDKVRSGRDDSPVTF